MSVIKNILAKNETDTAIVDNINSKRQWFLEETRPVRRQWLINAAFARGNQWGRLKKTEDKIININPPPNRKQITVDLMCSWKEHMIANMVLAMPKFEAIPETLEADAVSSARAGTSLLNYYWDTWKFILQYINISTHLMDFGNTFVYLNYLVDGSKFTAREVMDPETGNILYDDDGNPVYEQHAVGDIISSVLPPQNIVCPLDMGDIDSKPWVMIVQSRDLDYFPQQYGKKGKEVAPDNDMKNDNYNLYRISSLQGNNSNSKQTQTANEIIYFQKPNNTNPDGKIIVVSGNVVLMNEKWAYAKMTTYPLIHFHLNKESGEFFARSWIERQIPIQKSYNLLWSIIMENADDMCHLKWLLPRQADCGQLTDMPDIVDYTYPFRPEQSDLKAIPAYIVQMLNLLEMKMRDAQNYHGASLGTSVSGVRSDVHAENLQNQDMLPLTVVDNLMEQAFENMGEKILLMAAEKLEVERIISYLGEDKRYMIQNFKGSMLGTTRKVKVRMSNTWMRNKAAVVNNILQMFQFGMITDNYGMPDAKSALRMLEFAIPDSIFRKIQNSSEIAYLDIEKMMRGEEVLALPWQDHKLHLDILNEFMNSPSFMKLFENKDANALIIQLCMNNMNEHSQMFAKALGGLKPLEKETQSSKSKPKADK